MRAPYPLFPAFPRRLASALLLTLLLGPGALAEARREAPRIDARLRQSGPAPMPSGDPGLFRPGGAGKVVIHTPDGETELRDGALADGLPTSGRSGGGEGHWERMLRLYDLEMGDALEGPSKNFGGWSFQGNPGLGSLARRTKLWIKFEGASKWSECSGTLIDPLHVLTAGHCVFSQSTSTWADSLIVAPAYDNGVTPFGTARVKSLLSWQDWTQNFDPDDDIGVIQLDRPVGALSGWFGFGYDESCSHFESGSWHHAGWPAEAPFDGEFMYENVGVFDDCGPSGSSNIHGFDMGSAGGLSGAGAERDDTIYAVLSTSDRTTHSSDCALDGAKFTDLSNWIGIHTPSSYDLMPLAVSAPPVATAGQSISTFTFLLHNYSSDWVQDDWNYTIYLSSDDQIGPGDVPLRNGSFQAAIGGKSSFWIDIPTPGVIPTSTPAGNYFLGIRLDDPDVDSSNNDSSQQDASPITINCPSAPPAPQLLNPQNAMSCRPTAAVTLSWEDLGAGVIYEVEIYNKYQNFNYVQTGNAYHQILNLFPGVEYKWRVRAKSSCGSFGPWSSQRSFSTIASAATYPDLIAPSDGLHCTDTAGTLLDWSDLDGATSYELRISGNWCYEGAVITGIPSSEYLIAGLQPNTTYYWAVRAQLDCGLTSDWTSVPAFCWTFKTAPTSIAPPVPKAPWNGDPCVASTVLLHWENIEDWAGYEAQIGTSCGAGTIYGTPSNGAQVTGLVADVTYHWRVRAYQQCGLQSGWSTCSEFTVDDVLPTNPASITNFSHTPGVWSLDDTIQVAWPSGADDCSPVNYATLWDQSQDTEPTEPTHDFENGGDISPPLPDAQNHWFHLRAVDYAGNLAATTLHMGPYWIDANAPSQVQNFASSIPWNLPGDYEVLDLAWEASTDAVGVLGYSYVNGFDAGGPGPDAQIETTTVSTQIALHEHDNWIRISAVDPAGNVSTTSELGPFVHKPWLPGFLSPSAGQQLSEGEVHRIRWEPMGTLGGSLHLSLDGGLNWSQIASLSAPEILAGYYDWTVPMSGSNQAVLKLTMLGELGTTDAGSHVFELRQITAVEPPAPTPGVARLLSNAPNPFNPRTSIAFELDAAQSVRLEIYDAVGHRVRRLLDEDRPAGRHESIWNGRDDADLSVSSGVYYVRLLAGGRSQSHRMVLLK